MLDESTASQHRSRRDAGLAIARRANRWLLVGAVAGTGAISLAAAHTFPGRRAAAAAAAIAGGSSQPAGQQGVGASGLQAPSQGPTAAVAAPTAVVSGGS